MFRHHSGQQAGREDAEEGNFPTAAGTQTEPEDPVGSVSEQQLEANQGSTRIASSPTAVSGSVGREEGGGSGGREMTGASGAQLGEATPRMPPPPPPPLSSQPLPFLFHGGYPTERQSGGADISFATESADTATALNASGVNPGLSSASVPAPPIPPPTFNPYYTPFQSPYHMNPYVDSSSMSHPAYGGVPPLGSSFAPSFPRGHFSNSPLLRPNHLPGYPYRSPVRCPPHHYHHPHPQQWGDHPSPPRPSMFGSPGHGPPPPPPAQFAPHFPSHPTPPRVSPYPPSLMHHLPPLSHPPFGGHVPPSFPPAAGFNTSLSDGSGLHVGNIRPSTLLPAQAELHGSPFTKVVVESGLGLHSPSGTTAASLQVQPPSSPPPSVPSINLQQPSASNLNNCNAASMAMPNLGTANSLTGMTTSLPLSTSTGGTTLQIPAVSPTGGANSTPALVQSSLVASNSGVSTLELGPGPGPGPDTASSFPSLVKPIDFTKETGAASLLAWKGHAFGSVPSGPVTAGGEVIVEGAERGAGGDHRQPAVEKEESVSSLPVSIPEELRLRACFFFNLPPPCCQGQAPMA